MPNINGRRFFTLEGNMVRNKGTYKVTDIRHLGKTNREGKHLLYKVVEVFEDFMFTFFLNDDMRDSDNLRLTSNLPLHIVKELYPKRFRIYTHPKFPWQTCLIDVVKSLLYPYWQYRYWNPRPVSIRNHYFRNYFGLPTIYPKIKGIYVDSSGNKTTYYE